MTEDKRPIGQRSYETQAVKERMEALPVGGTLTYADLDAIVKGDSREDKRHHVSHARKIVLNEKCIVLRCVPGIGYERIEGADILHDTTRDIAHVRRTARTGKKKLGAVDFDALSDTQRLEWSGRAVQLHLMERAGSEKVARRLQAAATGPARKEIPSEAESLSALQAAMRRK